MRSLSFAGACVAGLGLILATAPTSASNVNPPSQAFRGPSMRTTPTKKNGHRADTPAPCSTDYSGSGTYFVGAQADGNIAGGDNSAVLGGSENTACDADSGIGAGFANAVGNGDNNAVESFVGAGFAARIYGELSFIGAGGNNEITPQITPEQQESFIGAGEGNLVTGVASFIGAGGHISDDVPGNQVSGEDSFLGAGDQNNVSANDGFVGAGAQNIVGGADGFVGAGQNNKVTAAGADAVIAGGAENEATGQKAAVGGGELNGAEASFATVPGGYHNLAAGNESFAAGSQAEALHSGSFVWSDYASGEAPLNDGNSNQFVVRASGGMYVYSNAKSPYSGVKLGPGSGTWASVSDRNAKTDVAPLDDASVLAKVAKLPVTVWRYKTESGVRHVGPMAQDFYAAFGVGEDDRHITSIDEDGVALAAIKALDAKIRFEDGALRSDNRALHTENVALKANARRVDLRLASLEAAVTALTHPKH